MAHAPSSDPLRLAAESLERFLGRRRGRLLYALALRADGSATLTIFDGERVASADLSEPMVEQLIGQLGSRPRGARADEGTGSKFGAHGSSLAEGGGAAPRQEVL
ncbi:MAG: hypothetical protein JOZ02_13215 [Acidobacteria bacterium]|nr:hypothetical protein [Acidobacteriota bacterium]